MHIAYLIFKYVLKPGFARRQVLISQTRMYLNKAVKNEQMSKTLNRHVETL